MVIVPFRCCDIMFCFLITLAHNFSVVAPIFHRLYLRFPTLRRALRERYAAFLQRVVRSGLGGDTSALATLVETNEFAQARQCGDGGGVQLSPAMYAARAGPPTTVPPQRAAGHCANLLLCVLLLSSSTNVVFKYSLCSNSDCRGKHQCARLGLIKIQIVRVF